MLMSSALFRQASYDAVVEWIWSLGDISSGGVLQLTTYQSLTTDLVLFCSAHHGTATWEDEHAMTA